MSLVSDQVVHERVMAHVEQRLASTWSTPQDLLAGRLHLERLHKLSPPELEILAALEAGLTPTVRCAQWP